MKPKYKVLRNIILGYGSNVRGPTPDRYKTHPPGALLFLDSTPQAVQYTETVWFIDDTGQRGKIDAGNVDSLVADGVLENSLG